MAAEIRFVFFDVGNTLLFPNRARIDAPLTERGMTPDKAHLRDLECRTKNSFDSQMTRTGSTDKSFWWMFYEQLLAEIGVKDEALLEQLVTNIRDSGNWDQIPTGTRERLEKIAEHYRVAVISNADGRIEDVLRKCGIADCFLSITDSGLVGYEKPDAQIFQRALESLKANPEESLYVGDVYAWIISARPELACTPC